MLHLRNDLRAEINFNYMITSTWTDIF